MMLSKYISKHNISKKQRKNLIKKDIINGNRRNEECV